MNITVSVKLIDLLIHYQNKFIITKIKSIDLKSSNSNRYFFLSKYLIN